jgi:hypothetical protein
VLNTLNIDLGDISPLKDLLTRLNFQNQPKPQAIITSVERAEALKLLIGLVHPDTIRFIYRILMSQFSLAAQKREESKGFLKDGYLFISHSYIRKAYHRDVETELLCLIDLGVLEATKSKKGKCRGWRVTCPELIWAFITPIKISTPKLFLDLSNTVKVRLPSDIAREANKAIPVGLMNLTEVTRYFDRKIGLESSDLDCLMTDLDYVMGCWHDREDWDEATGILTYRQHFHTAVIGGRVYAKSGDALVNRELKKHWFNIPKAENYDIKAAHVASFNQLYPTDFGDNWVKDDGFRGSIAKQVGVSVATVKIAVLSLTYGGKLRTTSYKNKNWEDVLCTIFQAFVNEVGHDGALLAMEKFKILTSEYQAALKLWHGEIKSNPKKWQRNVIGMVTSETKPETLASHYLQGKEQQAIRWISNCQNQRIGGYKVISNQYDGVVTLGNIPSQVLKDFQTKFKLTLEPKPL